MLYTLILSCYFIGSQRSIRELSKAENQVKRMKRESTVAYHDFLVEVAEVADVVEAARRAAARSVNAVMTATYWFVGRRIVEHEQQGAARAAYGERLLKRLARDLSERFGRGFSERNLEQMRAFYLGWPISQIASAKSPSSGSRRAKRISQTASAKFIEISADAIHSRFRLPWSHYARLLAVRSVDARAFYESEALRGGWTIRQLDRQIQSQFYERTALSRDKAAMLRVVLARWQATRLLPTKRSKTRIFSSSWDSRTNIQRPNLRMP
jgi:DUF1016 N-terminal domain